MHVYADTSAMFAMYYVRDPFAELTLSRRARTSPAFLYPPWLRFELRHVLMIHREDQDGEAAWRALLASERHFLGVRENWLAVLQLAEELSLRHAREIVCGGVDVLHVASALRLAADEFWTCDDAQAALARVAKLKVVDFSKGL